MATDTVITVFGGDDSNFQAAARKVKSSLENLAGFVSPMKFFKEAKEGAESLHSATEHAKAGVEALKSAFAPLIGMGVALVGVGSIFEGIRHSIEQASEREIAGFRFEAIAGGADKARSAMEKLEAISAETGTDFPQLEIGAQKLVEAGLSADSAAEAMGRLQKIALNSGSDVNELAEIYARVNAKADVTSKDLVKLAMAGVPGIAAIAREFKTVEQNTASANLEIDRTIAQLGRLYEQQEKQVTSANSFGQKIGLMQASFAQWARSGGSAIGSLVTAIDGISGRGISTLSGSFGAQFSEGLRQIQTETGLTASALGTFMSEGKIGFEDLISASARFREEQHKQETAGLEAQKLANQNALLAEQKGLLGQVQEAIKNVTDPGGIFSSIGKFLQTFAGEWRQLKHAIDEAFEAFGKPLIDSLKPALDQLTGFFKGPAIDAVTIFGNYLGGLIDHAMLGLTLGDWGPLEQDGINAFKAILESARTGFINLGIVLRDIFSGSETIEVLQSFGQVFKDVMSMAVDTVFKKLTTIHIGMSEKEIQDYEAKQEAIEKAKGPSLADQKLLDDINKLMSATGGLGVKIGTDLTSGGGGGPTEAETESWVRQHQEAATSQSPATEPPPPIVPPPLTAPTSEAGMPGFGGGSGGGRFTSFVPGTAATRSGGLMGGGSPGGGMPSVFAGSTLKERWADYDRQMAAYNAAGAPANIIAEHGSTGTAFQPPGRTPWAAPPGMEPTFARGGIATGLPPAAGSSPAAAGAVGTILAKIDVLIETLTKETGMLEKVLT